LYCFIIYSNYRNTQFESYPKKLITHLLDAKVKNVNTIKNSIIVGIIITLVVITTIAIVYAQQGVLVNNNTIEPLGKRWGCGDTVANKTYPLHLMYLWRFRGYWRNAKLQVIETSEEYKAKVIEILNNDADAKKFLENGYNITLIRPIVKLYVQGDGNVILRSTEAMVTLFKKGEGIVRVLVDIENNKVIKILHYTIIEKE
jgi:hypothetical protein